MLLQFLLLLNGKGEGVEHEDECNYYYYWIGAEDWIGRSMGQSLVVLLANYGVVQWVERRRLVQALNDLSGREMLRGWKNGNCDRKLDHCF